MSARPRGSSDTQRCPACRAPLLVQWVGHTAALKASVDLLPAEEPRPYAAAAAASTPDDLVWCLPRQRFRAPRLRWTSRGHPPDCPHQHLTTHRCPPTTLF